MQKFDERFPYRNLNRLIVLKLTLVSKASLQPEIGVLAEEDHSYAVS